MTADDTVFTGKVYLVKMKESDHYQAADILWTICHKGKDNVDLEDIHNIVRQLNNKGLFTPVISHERSTWKAIKTDVECKALKLVGDPTLLFENVHTFKEIITFAYGQGLLDNPRGREILAVKAEAVKPAAKKSRKSMSLVEASNIMSGRPIITSAASIMNKVAKQSEGLNAALNVDPSASLGLSQAESQLTAGCSGVSAFTRGRDLFPASVDGVVLDNLESDPAQPNGRVEKADSVDRTEDGVAAFVDVVSSAIPQVQAGVTFHPQTFNIDDIDNEIDNLENDAALDTMKKLERYMSLTRTLRKSINCVTANNQQLLKVADANEMKLREFKAYSASEVLEGMKPSLNTIASLSQKLNGVISAISNLDTKFSSEINSVRVEMGELSASISNNSEAAEQGSDKIVRHLGSFGLVNSGSTFDIPQALSSIHGMLSNDVVPIFKAGLVERGEPREQVLLDSSRAKGEPSNVLGECMANVGMISNGLDGSSVEMMSVDSFPPASGEQRPLMHTPQDFALLERSYGPVQTPHPVGPGSAAIQSYASAPPLFPIPTPVALHAVQNHYRGAMTPQHNNQGGTTREYFPMHAPQKNFDPRIVVTPEQRTLPAYGHYHYVQEGQGTVTGAARTLYQNHVRNVTAPVASSYGSVEPALGGSLGDASGKVFASGLGHVVNTTGPTPPGAGVIVTSVSAWKVNKGNVAGSQ